jgi:hypothetical protein
MIVLVDMTPSRDRVMGVWSIPLSPLAPTDSYYPSELERQSGQAQVLEKPSQMEWADWADALESSTPYVHWWWIVDYPDAPGLPEAFEAAVRDFVPASRAA